MADRQWKVFLADLIDDLGLPRPVIALNFAWDLADLDAVLGRGEPPDQAGRVEALATSMTFWFARMLAPLCFISFEELLLGAGMTLADVQAAERGALPPPDRLKRLTSLLIRRGEAAQRTLIDLITPGAEGPRTGLTNANVATMSGLGDDALRRWLTSRAADTRLTDDERALREWKTFTFTTTFLLARQVRHLAAQCGTLALDPERVALATGLDPDGIDETLRRIADGRRALAIDRAVRFATGTWELGRERLDAVRTMLPQDVIDRLRRTLPRGVVAELLLAELLGVSPDAVNILLADHPPQLDELAAHVSDLGLIAGVAQVPRPSLEGGIATMSLRRRLAAGHITEAQVGLFGARAGLTREAVHDLLTGGSMNMSQLTEQRDGLALMRIAEVNALRVPPSIAYAEIVALAGRPPDGREADAFLRWLTGGSVAPPRALDIPIALWVEACRNDALLHEVLPPAAFRKRRDDVDINRPELGRALLIATPLSRVTATSIRRFEEQTEAGPEDSDVATWADLLLAQRYLDHVAIAVTEQPPPTADEIARAIADRDAGAEMLRTALAWGGGPDWVRPEDVMLTHISRWRSGVRLNAPLRTAIERGYHAAERHRLIASVWNAAEPRQPGSTLRTTRRRLGRTAAEAVAMASLDIPAGQEGGYAARLYKWESGRSWTSSPIDLHRIQRALRLKLLEYEAWPLPETGPAPIATYLQTRQITATDLLIEVRSAYARLGLSAPSDSLLESYLALHRGRQKPSLPWQFREALRAVITPRHETTLPRPAPPLLEDDPLAAELKQFLDRRGYSLHRLARRVLEIRNEAIIPTRLTEIEWNLAAVLAGFPSLSADVRDTVEPAMARVRMIALREDAELMTLAALSWLTMDELAEELGLPVATVRGMATGVASEPEVATGHDALVRLAARGPDGLAARRRPLPSTPEVPVDGLGALESLRRRVATGHLTEVQVWELCRRPGLPREVVRTLLRGGPPVDLNPARRATLSAIRAAEINSFRVPATSVYAEVLDGGALIREETDFQDLVAWLEGRAAEPPVSIDAELASWCQARRRDPLLGSLWTPDEFRASRERLNMSTSALARGMRSETRFSRIDALQIELFEERRDLIAGGTVAAQWTDLLLVQHHLSHLETGELEDPPPAPTDVAAATAGRGALARLARDVLPHWDAHHEPRAAPVHDMGDMLRAYGTGLAASQELRTAIRMGFATHRARSLVESVWTAVEPPETWQWFAASRRAVGWSMREAFERAGIQLPEGESATYSIYLSRYELGRPWRGRLEHLCRLQRAYREKLLEYEDWPPIEASPDPVAGYRAQHGLSMHQLCERLRTAYLAMGLEGPSEQSLQVQVERYRNEDGRATWQFREALRAVMTPRDDAVKARRTPPLVRDDPLAADITRFLDEQGYSLHRLARRVVEVRGDEVSAPGIEATEWALAAVLAGFPSLAAPAVDAVRPAMALARSMALRHTTVAMTLACLSRHESIAQAEDALGLPAGSARRLLDGSASDSEVSAAHNALVALAERRQEPIQPRTGRLNTFVRRIPKTGRFSQPGPSRGPREPTHEGTGH